MRRAMIQLAWRFLMFQKDSALAQWYRARTEGGRKGRAQDHDRGAGAQAADRLVAHGHHRGGAGRRPPASGAVSARADTRPRHATRRAHSLARAGLTIRGGGNPLIPMAFMPRNASWPWRFTSTWADR